MSIGEKNYNGQLKKKKKKRIGKLNKSLEFFFLDIRSTDFRRNYTTEKTAQWWDEMKLLIETPIIEPQTAFGACIHGAMHEFNFFIRTILVIEGDLEPLDTIISN